jgi:hypothetical protein
LTQQKTSTAHDEQIFSACVNVLDEVNIHGPCCLPTSLCILSVYHLSINNAVEWLCQNADCHDQPKHRSSCIRCCNCTAAVETSMSTSNVQGTHLARPLESCTTPPSRL